MGKRSEECINNMQAIQKWASEVKKLNSDKPEDIQLASIGAILTDIAVSLASIADSLERRRYDKS